MLRHWLVASLLLTCVWTSATPSAHAQLTDDERARLHFESGRSYYEQARYEDAAREFREAYELSGRTALLLNASHAYERALRFEDAIAEIERYLRLEPDTGQRKTLEQRVRRLRDLQARFEARRSEEEAEQTSTGAAPDSEPGAPAGPPEPGAAEIDPARPGAAATREPAGSSEPGSSEPAQPGLPGLQPSDAGGPSLSVPGLILAGSGAALLIGSLVTGLMAHSRYSDLDESCPDHVCPSGAGHEDDIDTGKTLGLISTITLFAGVAAAGAGGTLILLGLGEDEKPSRAAGSGAEARTQARLEIGPGPGWLGASARLRL